MSGRSTNFWPGEEILVIPLIPLAPPETVPVLGVSAATFGEKPNSSWLPTLHFKAFNWIFQTELTVNYLRLWLSLSTDSSSLCPVFPSSLWLRKNHAIAFSHLAPNFEKKQITFLFSEVFPTDCWDLCPCKLLSRGMETSVRCSLFKVSYASDTFKDVRGRAGPRCLRGIYSSPWLLQKTSCILGLKTPPKCSALVGLNTCPSRPQDTALSPRPAS